MTALAPEITLRSGVRLPAIGLGTWPMDDAGAEHAVAQALQAGWRLIDTAENYGNERGVGRALRAAGVPREQVFITTKFNRQWHSVQGVADACAASCERLDVAQIDLLLIHWPNPDQGRYLQAWEGLLRLQEAGRVRCIGTSNFTQDQLQALIDATGTAPEVNQIQLSPFWPQTALRAFHARHRIVTESWSPVGRGAELLARPAVQAVAARHGRTPGQVVLRWHLQQGLLPIPKSADAQRQRENLAVFDFTLDDADIAELDTLAGQGPAMLDPMRFGH